MSAHSAVDAIPRPAHPGEPLAPELQRLIGVETRQIPVKVKGAGRPAVEAPTLLLAVLVYAGWLAVTLSYGRAPLALLAALGAALLALHGSLQHEIVHGHPTRWLLINTIIGTVPLSLWLPYLRYRDTHLQHHINDRLTDPLDDPESYYFLAEDWARLPTLARGIVWAQQTLAGRMLIGPFWIVGRFLMAEMRAVLHNEHRARAIWLVHVLCCIPVILWVTVVCRIPLWLYVLAMVAPGTALTLIRSFAEHRARTAVLERIAIVEDSWILGPLFLFNNLHALHHETPGLPWYSYNARYRRERERLIAANGGLVYRTYFDVARRYLFRPHDTPQHPLGRAPSRP